MKQIFWILMTAVVVILGTAWFIHRALTGPANGTDAYVRNRTGGRTSLRTPPTASADRPAQTEGPATASPAATQQGALTPPASDSIRRNPPNGMAFAGSGKYQLYRQGDITWRIDTETGDACILFATNALWRNSEVYSHGCGAV